MKKLWNLDIEFKNISHVSDIMLPPTLSPFLPGQQESLRIRFGQYFIIEIMLRLKDILLSQQFINTHMIKHCFSSSFEGFPNMIEVIR